MRTETINLYTLEEAEKIINYRRRKATRKKIKQLKQKFILKGLSLALVVLGLIIASVVKFDNGGCLVAALIGLMGLVIPFDMEIAWWMWYDSRSGGGTMIYGLTEADLQRLDKEAIKNLIADEEKRLNVWSIPNYEKKQIKEEIKQLKELLKR